MSNEQTIAVAVFQPQNMQKMSDRAEMSFHRNTSSHDKCLEIGQYLLGRIKTEGMSEELFTKLLWYLDKAKKTIKEMNERRTPVTKTLNMICKVYTTMENEVSIDKAGTIPYQVQQHANAWVKKKHEEEQARLRAEAARLAKETAKTNYRAAVEDDYVTQFNALVNKSINELTDMDKSLCLDNYDMVGKSIKAYSCELPATWCEKVISCAHRPVELTPDECRAIQANVMAGLVNRFKEQFLFEVQSTRDDIVDRLPSKRRELERIANASADDAARMKAAMEAKEREEATRKEAERAERERQEKAAAELAAKKQEMDGLFGMPVAPATPVTKAQVKKKAVISSADDIMRVVAFWWSQVGCTLTIEELCKEFKKQITYANTAANSKNNPVLISGILYEDEVKAK